jgi:ADP-ribose pyrophosphatase YjhB (NUDIX family)
MVSEISGGFVVREKKLLMLFDESEEKWAVPSAEGNRGEISADAAVRAVENVSGCEAEVSRYRRRLKTSHTVQEDEITWQSYSIEMEGEPEKGQWVPISDLESKDLVSPLDNIREKLVDRL